MAAPDEAAMNGLASLDVDARERVPPSRRDEVGAELRDPFADLALGWKLSPDRLAASPSEKRETCAQARRVRKAYARRERIDVELQRIARRVAAPRALVVDDVDASVFPRDDEIDAAAQRDGARVIVLSSDGHRMGDVDFEDPNWERREYDKFAAYGASKTANVLHAVELDRRLRDSSVRAFAVHPGIVATSLARHMTDDDFTALNNAGSRGSGGPKVDVRKQFTMPEHGAATQVWAAVSDELDGCGALYLSDCGVAAAAPYAMDETRALALWALSEHLCTPSARRLGSSA